MMKPRTFFWAWAGCSIGIAGCAVPEGVDYAGTVLPAVDMHLHTGEWSLIPPSTQKYLAERFPFPFSLVPDDLAESSLSAEGVIGQLDDAGLNRGVLFAVYAPHSVGIATNEFVMSQLEKAPNRLYGLASLRVDQWADNEVRLVTARIGGEARSELAEIAARFGS